MFQQRAVAQFVRALGHQVQQSSNFVRNGNAASNMRRFMSTGAARSANGASRRMNMWRFAGGSGTAMLAASWWSNKREDPKEKAAENITNSPDDRHIDPVAEKSEKNLDKLYRATREDTFQPMEGAAMAFAPNVPPPISRNHSATVRVDLITDSAVGPLNHEWQYLFWRFNGAVPGPFIRTRVGDTLQLNLTNKDETGMPHNIDLHAVFGPGGGAVLTTAEVDQTKSASFKMMCPGLYVYHCAAAPVPLHIANGMYGLILVEPEEGLPKVDKEFYVMQSEFYVEPPANSDTDVAEPSYPRGLREQPNVVVFNGREGSLTESNMLRAKCGDRVRIYFGNAGPNLTSSFHVIGTIFETVYREGDVMSAPGRYIQTTSVPAGGSAIVEFTPRVPGTYTLVDHSIFRLEKGCVGFLSVSGEKNPEVFHSDEAPAPCVGCKLHP